MIHFRVNNRLYHANTFAELVAILVRFQGEPIHFDLLGEEEEE